MIEVICTTNRMNLGLVDIWTGEQEKKKEQEEE
jgi:hypothetical protein